MTAIPGNGRTDTRGRAATTRARRGYRVVAAASALLVTAGLALVAQAPASAATGQQASAQRASTSAHPAAKPATANGHRALPPVTGLGKGDDYKPACSAPKKAGYAACMALVRTNIKTHKGITTDTAPSGYGPSDLQSAYDLPSATAGSGETVAIVDAGDDPTAEADLGVYRSQYGLPPCTTANGCFEKVNQEGQQGNYPPDIGWDDEESLDVDMVSAICPNCHILLVEANSALNTDLGASVDEAVALGAEYVSNSYGSSDSPNELQEDAYYNHPGTVITASAGDGGYGVNYPSASQYVTAVGGTTLTQDPGTPRGWDETVWGSASGGQGTGSGCSAYEPKPNWQKDTGCANRTTADVSAVANPNTGVAVYDSLDGGWDVFGGTSVASPVIASVYALAGSPVAGTYPSSYPYADPSGLNDVTSGANGTCTPAYLCTAGPGYDGPTGLGTPDGVNAFSGGPHGDVTGQVTSASTGKPLAGAQVSANGGSTVTSADGDYDLTLPAGTYNVTAADYGYRSQTTDGVTVTDNATTSESFPLTALPTATVSGTVTDGSGHGWPLYATITAAGVPGAPVYTNPYTGAYRVTLPQSATYTLTVTPVQPGYQTAAQQVSVGTSNITQNITVPVNNTTTGCTAPGYGVTETGGISEQFTGWTGTMAQDGWTNVDNEGNGETWTFDNPGGRTPPPGGDADFAIVDSANYNNGNSQDTSLVSPVVNLSGVSSPEIAFDTYYYGFSGQTADVDLSLDGGRTWTNVWEQTTTTVQGLVVIPVPQAADQSDVQVQFHYAATFGAWWELDNVAIGGDAGCNPLPGGLIAGVVKDGNTGQPLNSAMVSGVAALSAFGVSAATPGDPGLPDGFYEFFAPLTGGRRFTATEARYQPQAKSVTVAAGAVTKANFTLQAGRLSVASALSATMAMGGTVTRQLTFTNTGKAAVQVTVGEQSGSFTSLNQPASSSRGAPLKLVKVNLNSLQGLARQAAGSATAAQARPAAAPGDTPWTEIPSPPLAPGATYPTWKSAAAYDGSNGKLYVVGGISALSALTDGFAYDPAERLWTQIADMPLGVIDPMAAVINGKLYVAGGWYGSGFTYSPSTLLQIYNPETNTWTIGASMPAAEWGATTATLDGQMYLVGGCAGGTGTVDGPGGCNAETGLGDSPPLRYDPATNSWTTIAPYPVGVTSLACGGVAGELACTGGLDNLTGASYKATYIYDPATNTWSRGANLPIELWGMGYAAANGQLLVSGGATRNSTAFTNQGFAYQPGSNSWTKLPNTNTIHYLGASACGFFQIGGYSANTSVGVHDGTYYDFAGSEELPGYDQCGDDGTQVPWLLVSPSQVSVPAGGSATVSVTLDGGAAGVTQPGAYTAELHLLSTDTPYATPAVGVTMNVTPPKTWGKITGTVSGTACDGTTSPLAGATLQIDSWAGDDTLTTDASGQYGLWLDRRSNPLTVIVAENGWRSQSREVKIEAGQAVTSDFTLTPQACS